MTANALWSLHYLKVAYLRGLITLDQYLQRAQRLTAQH